MRTIDAIVHRCVYGSPFEREALVGFLPFMHARPFLQASTTDVDWERDRLPATEDAVLALMRDYAIYAWGEIHHHREDSARRADIKMQAWLWLLGRDDLLEVLSTMPYFACGKARLALICATLGFPYAANAYTYHVPA